MIAVVGTLGIVLAALAASHVEAATSAVLCHVGAIAPQEDFYDLMDKGVSAREAKDFAAVARYMTAAYEAMPPKERIGRWGQKAVREALEAYRALHAKDGKEESLQAARELLRKYIDELDARESAAPPSEGEAYLRKALTELEFAPEPEPEPEEGPAQDSPVEPTEPPPPLDDDLATRKLRTRGLGLMATGVPLVAGGAVLLVQGLRFPSLVTQAKQEAQAEIDASNGGLEATGWDTHEGEQRTKGNTLVGVGAGVAAAGAVLTIWGSVWFVKGKKAPVAASPTASDSSVGLVISGRF